MRAPRRIFRNSRRPRLFRTALVGVAAVLGAGLLGAMGVSEDLFGRLPAEPDHLAADATHVAVVGGDTLRLDGHVVRLRGIEAPARGDVCQGGGDCGGAATSALAGLVRDRRVECRVIGRDTGGRPIAACEANGTDLSRAVVASGWARALPGVPELTDLELRARQQGAGLWAAANRR